MRIELNHTLVASKDKKSESAFFAKLVDAPVSPQWGPFLTVTIPTVDFDFIDFGDYKAIDNLESMHLAFLVDDEKFDQVMSVIEAEGWTYYADQYLEEPGTINHLYGGRGVYIESPSGHRLEFITAPYSGRPGGLEKGKWAGAAEQLAADEGRD